jgi:hypothetical protein
MVDSISGKPNSIQDASLLNINQQQSVEKVNSEAASSASNAGTLSLVDEATISDAARSAYESEKEILKFGRLAQRVKPSYDAEKVARFKDMIDNGRINDYMRSLNTDQLAQSMLDSPSGAFLR